MNTPPPRRMSLPFRLWFAFLGLVAVGMIAAAVWSALVVVEAGPEGYRGINPPPASSGPASSGPASSGPAPSAPPSSKP